MEASLSVKLVTSQIFNNYAVGVGALIAGVGGFKLLIDWGSNFVEQVRRRRLEIELRGKYLPNRGGYELIASSSNPDWIYLHDKKTNRKHHIASNATFLALGYDRSMVKHIGKQVFDSIGDGDEFLTRGEKYS